MVRHNNMISHQHFHKDWQRRVRVKFNDTGKKKARKQARAKKAIKLAPRPINKLRPVVRCPSGRYNSRIRLGRGFTPLELKQAKLRVGFAKTIGISIDFRRKDKSMETLEANVRRLTDYAPKIMIIPRGMKPRDDPLEAKAPGVSKPKFTPEVLQLTDDFRNESSEKLFKARYVAKLRRHKQKSKKKVEGMELDVEFKK